MNSLEKIKALIQTNDVEVFMGTPINNWKDMYIGLSVSESPATRHYFRDVPGTRYRRIRIDLYCTDYLNGFELMEQIKAKIDNAEKSTMQIWHEKDLDSWRDTSLSKHVLTTIYKEII